MLKFIYFITRKHHLVPNPEIKMYQKVIYCMDPLPGPRWHICELYWF